MNRLTIITTASALALGLSTALAGDNHYEPGSGGHLFVMDDELEWGTVGSMGEGAEIAVIEGDLGSDHRPAGGKHLHHGTRGTHVRLRRG